MPKRKADEGPFDENLAVVTGQLYRNPQVVTVNGKDQCRFVLIHRRRTSQGDLHYFRCRVDGDLAVVCHRRLRKGFNVYIRGEMIPEPTYTDAKGIQRSVIYIDVKLCRVVLDDR